jgi:hypothetical protein
MKLASLIPPRFLFFKSLESFDKLTAGMNTALEVFASKKISAFTVGSSLVADMMIAMA